MYVHVHVVVYSMQVVLSVVLCAKNCSPACVDKWPRIKLSGFKLYKSALRFSLSTWIRVIFNPAFEILYSKVYAVNNLTTKCCINSFSAITLFDATIILFNQQVRWVRYLCCCLYMYLNFHDSSLKIKHKQFPTLIVCIGVDRWVKEGASAAPLLTCIVWKWWRHNFILSSRKAFYKIRSH